MKIGYARVSTNEQDTTPQFDALNEAGCERIYRENASGKSRTRLEELERMIDALREKAMSLLFSGWTVWVEVLKT